MTRIADETAQRKVKIIFHGGEPLQAPHTFWRQALHGLSARLGLDGYEVCLQSNLWLLNDELCQLFQEQRVDIGTSLDGPESINDSQRGVGSYARTMNGIRLAQAYGMKVGCIATFTPATILRWREVFDFFLAERFGFSIHAAVPRLNDRNESRAITPDDYGRLLCEMLDYYVPHRREISVSSLDQMCQGLGRGEGKVCTFRDCLGMFLAVDAHGDIYPCQRFCGRQAYRLGNLRDRPCLDKLLASPGIGRMVERQRQIEYACSGCTHLNYCRGGCLYNAWAHGHGESGPTPIVPHIRLPLTISEVGCCEKWRQRRISKRWPPCPTTAKVIPCCEKGR